MQHNKIRKILTALVIILGLLSIVDVMCFIGAGGILNDLDSALEEIENLEEKNLLNNPPENLSNNAKAELKTFHNSSGLKKYIKEYEASLANRNIYFCIVIALFFLSLILRIYFRKEKRK